VIRHGVIAAMAALVLSVLVLVFAGLSPVDAGDNRYRTFDRSVAHVVSSSSFMDVSAADYTSYQTLVTFAPAGSDAYQDVKVVLDLDTNNDATGFNGGHTSETVTFAIARKIEGSWRIDSEAETTAISGTNAASRSVTLDAGIVGAEEDLRVYVKVSAEAADAEFAYLVMYRGPSDATMTNVSN